MKLRIATRGSRLALWQAKWVRDNILAKHPGLDVQLVAMTTEGDRRLDRSLADIGGKGLFIKELEQSLLDHKADLAVHSVKDLTTNFPPNLELSVLTKRGESNDALVSNNYTSLQELPASSVIGTSSLRRMSQLRHFFPHLKIRNLRGNLDTRLRKLDEGEYDAIILAVAGLKRLGLGERIAQVIPHLVMLPAIAQGVIGIETRTDDHNTLYWINHLGHPRTQREVLCERTVLSGLSGNCHVPIAGFCVEEQSKLYLEARIGDPDGSKLLVAKGTDTPENPVKLGKEVTDKLLEHGAQKILDEFGSQT
jgi:hydroxymethylbilane synthase